MGKVIEFVAPKRSTMAPATKKNSYRSSALFASSLAPALPRPAPTLGGTLAQLAVCWAFCVAIDEWG